MAKYISSSEDKTKQIAEDLARGTKKHVFALTGELGAGKTIFVQGFAKGLGIKDKIISPTFVLIRQHTIPFSRKILYHIDLYRLDKAADLKNLGLLEIWSDPNNIVLIEWAERIKDFLPLDAVKINIRKGENQNRTIIIS
ncbi:tRNA (adenosine(37)-N6)-threonylcarbamoyltransferase complex ATPase subunit type 1 TsaE [Candidatus Daviesbacteria bacterium]|nr:tRNA (adenosine(37)-N6)-threonylcarbamoyltransferase complex ATPase subunit type 1 TsaE [Candidatus Daviesbacteria bacterium]